MRTTAMKIKPKWHFTRNIEGILEQLRYKGKLEAYNDGDSEIDIFVWHSRLIWILST